MGHNVQAFIGPKISVGEIYHRFVESKIIELPQGLFLLPVTDELYDAIPFQEISQVQKGFKFLDKKIVDLMIEISQYDCVGYFETNYFGGAGDQGAIFAKAGKIAHGPQCGDDSINALLKHLGVSVNGTHDEFEAIELGKFRRNEDWIHSVA